MAQQWYLLNSGKGDPPSNMAVDETLMILAPAIAQPVLRFYGWNTPAATFGYSQLYSEIEAATLLRPLIRRPTGGGLVPHDADWTYSLVVPPVHEWYDIKAEESYERIHAWIRDAFTLLNVPTMLSPCCQKEVPGQCFRGAEKHDLLWHGRKIAGAAQRRSKTGLLIQGSVQPPPISLQRTDWERAMCDVAGRQWQVTWSELDASARDLLQQAESLAAQKYGTAGFNQKR